MGDGANIATDGVKLGPLGRILRKEHGPSFTSCLGSHHRCVGACDKLTRVHRMFRALSNAYAYRYLSRPLDVQQPQPRLEPGRKAQSVTRVARGHDDRKLLAA